MAYCKSSVRFCCIINVLVWTAVYRKHKCSSNITGCNTATVINRPNCTVKTQCRDCNVLSETWAMSEAFILKNLYAHCACVTSVYNMKAYHLYAHLRLYTVLNSFTALLQDTLSMSHILVWYTVWLYTVLNSLTELLQENPGVKRPEQKTISLRGLLHDAFRCHKTTTEENKVN